MHACTCIRTHMLLMGSCARYRELSCDQSIDLLLNLNWSTYVVMNEQHLRTLLSVPRLTSFLVRQSEDDRKGDEARGFSSETRPYVCAWWELKLMEVHGSRMSRTELKCMQIWTSHLIFQLFDYFTQEERTPPIELAVFH